MASPWDSLAQAASVMQVIGVDAFGLVSKIVQAAHAAVANRDLCQQLAQHVQIVGGLLDKVDTPALRRHPETRRPLDQLDFLLSQAYELVSSCTKQQHYTNRLYQMLTATKVASKLRHAQEQIDRYISLFSMIALAGVINSRQGQDEGDEDVSNDAASNQRARLSHPDVAKSLALEELPPGVHKEKITHGASTILPMNTYVSPSTWNPGQMVESRKMDKWSNIESKVNGKDGVIIMENDRMIEEKHMHKNRLKEFAEQTYKKRPIYNVELEGECHLPKFRCTVEVGGQQFSSAGSFSHKKEAEQDAARAAYEILVARAEDDAKEMLGLIDQDFVFCKSILHEFTDKTKTTRPSYSVESLENPMTPFLASVVFDGNTYTGESAANKKDAEQKAARAVIKSILATGNTCMMDIIKSKKQFISAIRAEGSAKEH